MLSKPLTVIQASIAQIVSSAIGLAVGLGAMSPAHGGLWVSAGGLIVGALIQLGNAVYAMAHAKQTAAVLAVATPAVAQRAALAMGLSNG